MMDSLIVERSKPRICTARKIKSFQQKEIINLLFAGKDIQADFRIVEQVARPSAETCFDVCSDGKMLFVSILFWETGERPGLESQPFAGVGVGNNSIEILLCPYGDRIGFLQFGAGPGRATWFNHHWPYRDNRPNLTARPQWGIDYYFEKMGEDSAYIAFFQFPLSGIIGQEYTGPIGFNVMRTQFRTNESATWSHAGGNGFPDGTSCGWLRISEETSKVPDEPLFKKGPGDKIQLQGTYDFPDEMCGGIYTPEIIRKELKFLKRHGMGRIYWIDYPGAVEAVRKHTRGAPVYYPDFYERTIEMFGGDPMPVVCKIAHEEGLEFFTVIKPYDLWAGDIFVEAHPVCAFRRNPEWTTEYRGEHIAEISLFADNSEPLPFDVSDIKVYASSDNVCFERIDGVSIKDYVVMRPEYKWSPAGKQKTNSYENVRKIQVTGLNLERRYWTIEFPISENPGNFGNKVFLFAEVKSDKGELPFAPALRTRGSDFRVAGFDFIRSNMSAGWADVSEGMELRQALPAGSVLGLKIGHDLYYYGMLEPGFPEVRRYWLKSFIQRAIDAGVDGVDVRIAHHHECREWLSFAFAEPVIDVFRDRFGREPKPESADYEAVRRIRGEFHTQFLREAKMLLKSAGKKLEAHIEARMKTPPQYDTYTQIHWDYATWIDEGIVDGVNLKYLGPLNPWVHREIIPRAVKQCILVHVISAIGDPRSQSRTPEWTVEQWDMVRVAGLNGLNLYEIWVYLRTTPRGEFFPRGCSIGIFAALKEQMQELKFRNNNITEGKK